MRLSEEEFLTYSFLNLFSILLKAAHTRHHKVPVPLVVYIGFALGTIKRHLNIIETRFHVHNLTLLLSRLAKVYLHPAGMVMIQSRIATMPPKVRAEYHFDQTKITT